MLLQPHQSHWADDFAAICATIRSVLPNDSIVIEHVGSTSVKGLAAKPIIDIDLVFYPSIFFETIQAGLEKLGYYHNGDQGIEGREVFKRKNEVEQQEVLDTIRHHLYVCAADSKELKRHLRFRDHLRANEAARREYERLKYMIAEQANQDRKVYALLKEELAGDFIDAISD